MEEYGGLGYLGLFEFVVSSGKHYVGDAETEYLVCFLKEFVSCGIVVIQIFSHTYELCSLSGKNECFHKSFI